MKRLTIIFIALSLSSVALFAQPENFKGSRGDKGEFMATFKGQEAKQSFPMWVNRNIKYPQACSEQGIEGTVRVSFIVESNATLSNIKVVQSVHPLMDSAVVQLIRESPKEWTPIYDSLGVPRRLMMNLPVTFKDAKVKVSNKNTSNKEWYNNVMIIR